MITLKLKKTPFDNEETILLGDEWYGRTVYEAIPSDICESDVTVQVVHNLNDLNDQEVHQHILDEGDELVVRVVPEIGVALVGGIFGPGLFVSAVATATTAAVLTSTGLFLAGLINVAVSVGIGIGLQALLSPQQARVDRGGSKTYDFDTPHNSTQNGAPVALVYGKNRVGGQTLGIKKDITDDGKTSLSMLIGLGEGGELGWESIGGITEDTDDAPDLDNNIQIFINDQPISNFFSDVTVGIRMGTKHQSALLLFDDGVVESNNNIDVHISQVYQGTVLESVVTYDSLGNITSQERPEQYPLTYTTTSKPDFIDIIATYYHLFASPAGGDRVGEHRFTVEWKEVDDDWENAKSKEFITRENTRNQFVKSFRLDGLGKKKTDIRINLEPYLFTLENEYTTRSGAVFDQGGGSRSRSRTKNGLKWPKLHWRWDVESITEYTSEALTYPGKALISVNAIATEKLNGGDLNITAICESQKIRIFTNTEGAITFTTEYTNNPAWIILDILTSKRHGLGAFISDDIVDIQSFIDAAEWADELVPNGFGGQEKRYELNFIIDLRKSSWEWVAEICKSASFFILKYGAKYKIVPDKAASPIMMFGPGNSNAISVTYTDPRKRVNYVEMEIFNGDDVFTKDVVVSLDETIENVDSFTRDSLSLFGVTKKSQALRWGDLVRRQNKLQRRFVDWTADISSIRCEPLDVVDIAHTSLSWGIGSGNVISATSMSVVIDKLVVIDVDKTYYFRVFHSDGEYDQIKIVNTSGEHKTLQVDSVFTKIPVKGEVYTVGVETNITRLVRLLTIEREIDMTAKLAGIEYNAGAYNDDIIDLEEVVPKPGFKSTDLPPDVSNLSITEINNISTDGSVEVGLDISFSPITSPVLSHYGVWLGHQSINTSIVWSRNPIRFDDSSGFISLGLIQQEKVFVAVTPVSLSGMRKNPGDVSNSSVTFLGVIPRPNNVAEFYVSRSLDKLLFVWEPVSNLDLNYYEVRTGTVWESGIVIVTGTLDTQFETDLFFADPSGPTTQNFLIKAFNRGGSESEIAKSISFSIVPRKDVVVNVARNEKDLDWPGTAAGLFEKDDNLRLVTVSDPGQSSTASITITAFDLPATSGNQSSTNNIFAEALAPSGDGHKRTGTYETLDIDSGLIYIWRSTLLVEAARLDIGSTWDDSVFTWDSSSALSYGWAGNLADNPFQIIVQSKHADTVETLASSAYQIYAPQNRSFRYSKYRITIKIFDDTSTAEINDLRICIDPIETINSADEVDITSAAQTITYDTEYTDSTSIAISISMLDGTSGDYITITDRTKDSFKVTIKNSDNSVITNKSISYISRGF